MSKDSSCIDSISFVLNWAQRWHGSSNSGHGMYLFPRDDHRRIGWVHGYRYGILVRGRMGHDGMYVCVIVMMADVQTVCGYE